MSFYLEQLLKKLYDVCLANSSCCSFHSVDLWSYGGASSFLAFLLPVWITFRDGNLSLNFVFSKRWSEHVTPNFSDGNFRLNVRMLFICIVDCLTCSKFPLAVKWVLWFTLFTIATDTVSISDCCAFPFSFSWRAGRSLLRLRVTNCTILSHSHIEKFLNYLQCGNCQLPLSRSWLQILLLQLTHGRRSAFPDGLLLSFGYLVFLRNCLFSPRFLIDVLCLALSLSCHGRKNISRHWITSLLMSKLDHLFPFCSNPSEEYAAGARSLERSFWETNIFCCYYPRMSLTKVLNLW